MMKKALGIFICILVTVSVLAGCSKSGSNDVSVDEGKESTKSQATVDTMPTVLNTTEYMLYQNIFYNNQGVDYDGKEVSKKGTFAVIYDEYNSTTRYYVWGYNDQTKCCDWQWEIVFDDTNSLPSTGSLIEVEGIFKSDDKALDGYWISDAVVTVVQSYNGCGADVDMTSMDGTLERVQIANMKQFPEKFEGKSISAYGRVETPETFQHPYYDNCFSQQFETTDTVPAIGTEVVVQGTYQNGIIVDCTVSETTQY